MKTMKFIFLHKLIKPSRLTGTKTPAAPKTQSAPGAASLPKKMSSGPAKRSKGISPQVPEKAKSIPRHADKVVPSRQTGTKTPAAARTPSPPRASTTPKKMSSQVPKIPKSILRHADKAIAFVPWLVSGAKELLNQNKFVSSVSITIPSKDKNGELIDPALIDKWSESTQRKLSEWFGGYVSADKKGGWINEADDLVREDVIVCESEATPKAVRKHKKQMAELAKQLKTELNQESVTYKIGEQRCFI